MSDRFKFRAWFTASYTTDDGDKKEVGFYIENVAIDGYGVVVFFKEFAKDKLLKLGLTGDQIEEIIDYLDDNSIGDNFEYCSLEPDCIEQCTGLKDKNDRLIYEGDILLEKGIYRPMCGENKEINELHHIRWVVSPNHISGFILPEANYGTERTLEVIGNIHENEELIK